MYQNVTEVNFIVFDGKFWKSSEFYYTEPGQYSFNMDTVDAKSTLIQEPQRNL